MMEMMISQTNKWEEIQDCNQVIKREEITIL